MVKILPNTEGSYTKALRREAYTRQWEEENILHGLPKDGEMVCFRNGHSGTTMKFPTATGIHNSGPLYWRSILLGTTKTVIWDNCSSKLYSRPQQFRNGLMPDAGLLELKLKFSDPRHKNTVFNAPGEVSARRSAALLASVVILAYAAPTLQRGILIFLPVSRAIFRDFRRYSLRPSLSSS